MTSHGKSPSCYDSGSGSDLGFGAVRLTRPRKSLLVATTLWAGVSRRQAELKGTALPLSGGAEAACHLEGLKDKRYLGKLSHGRGGVRRWGKVGGEEVGRTDPAEQERAAGISVSPVSSYCELHGHSAQGALSSQALNWQNEPHLPAQPPSPAYTASLTCLHSLHHLPA